MNPSKEEYLQELSDELFAPARKKFTRLKVHASGRDDIWTMDIVDMNELLSYNMGYRYILTIMDVYSRYAWCLPLKVKTAEAVFAAFSSVVKEGRKPHKLWVDKGSEFYNSRFKRWCSENDCVMYSTFGDSKAAMIERFNKTLKLMMWRWFYAHNTRKWIDILTELVSTYNTTKHSAIGMTPEEASQRENTSSIDASMGLEKASQKQIDKALQRKHKFELGDVVRISRIKSTFEKGYTPNYSLETFTIDTINTPLGDGPITYNLTDSKEEKIEGRFYENELVKVKYPNIFLVDQVLKTKGKKPNRQYYVSWLGFGPEHNSWVPEADFTHTL